MSLRNISVTLECFIKKGDKYLMLQRNSKKRIMPGVWMAPGGHREFNEGLFECARREILEETGLKIKNLRIKAVGNAHLKDLKQEIFFTFVFADYESGELKNDLNEGTLAWLTPSEIANLDNLLAEIKYTLPDLFKDNSKVISYKAIYEKGNKLTSFNLEKS